MRQLLIVLILFCTGSAFGQSKSVTRFRDDFKENSNMFFYSSTLKMLNTENNPDLAGMLDEIEEIRVLNYEKKMQKFKGDDISKLKNSLLEEDYNSIMMINDSGNSIYLYSREKRGKTVGFVAIVDNKENLVLIDLIGNVDVKKFMELKQKLDTHSGNAS
jgi:hypothetical protein